MGQTGRCTRRAESPAWRIHFALQAPCHAVSWPPVRRVDDDGLREYITQAVDLSGRPSAPRTDVLPEELWSVMPEQARCRRGCEGGTCSRQQRCARAVSLPPRPWTRRSVPARATRITLGSYPDVAVAMPRPRLDAQPPYTLQERRAFTHVEAVPSPRGQQTIEVPPLGGTLVLFDSGVSRGLFGGVCWRLALWAALWFDLVV